MIVFGVALVLLLILGVQLQLQSRRDAHARQLVAHTLLVQRTLAELESDLLQVEAEHRGYLVRNEPAFLVRRDATLAVAMARLAQLKTLTRDNPEQQKRVRTIFDGVVRRVTRMRETTAVVRKSGPDAGRAQFDPGGAGSIIPVRARIADFRRAEASLYADRAQAVAASTAGLRWWLLATPALAIVVLAFGLVAVLRDLRARRKAEDERDRFFTLSLDMLCIASADGYFKRLSPAFTRTLGWSVDELKARPFLDFVHPDDRVATLAQVEQQTREGLPVLDFENRYSHKDGGWRLLSWRSAPQADGTMYATARDITARHDSELRIVELNRELLSRQSELEQANRELESFSYSISHDLRAPLRHIDGYARIVSEEVGNSLGDEARRYLDTIIGSTKRMGALIDDLLAFSRLGRKPLESREVDMQALATSVVAELRAQRGSSVPVEVGPLPAANGDPSLLRQVWTNLLSNALKYSEPRGAAARVVVAGEDRTEFLHYSVLDNGVGFDSRYADKLFGVFQRLHTKDEFEGTGVGLAIVQRIVHRHGGEVSATSELGHGACFSFQLPAGESA